MSRNNCPFCDSAYTLCPGHEDVLVIPEGPMLCGSDIAQAEVYDRFKGKSGSTWLVGQSPDRANKVYVSGKPGSRGFGGRTLTFKLVTGEEIRLTGPWKTNPRALLMDTGVDVMNHFMTQIVIAETRVKTYPVTYKGIIYAESAPVEGPYSRGQDWAERIADEFGYSVFLDTRNMGGGCSGSVNPLDPETGKRHKYVAKPPEDGDEIR